MKLKSAGACQQRIDQEFGHQRCLPAAIQRVALGDDLRMAERNHRVEHALAVLLDLIGAQPERQPGAAAAVWLQRQHAARQVRRAASQGQAQREAALVARLYASQVHASATKGCTGHTMGACGAIESAFCVAMMRDGFLAPTRNLEEIDPRCEGLDHIRELRRQSPRTIMSNNFAFGGVNTSLILGQHR